MVYSQIIIGPTNGTPLIVYRHGCTAGAPGPITFLLLRISECGLVLKNTDRAPTCDRVGTVACEPTATIRTISLGSKSPVSPLLFCAPARTCFAGPAGADLHDGSTAHLAFRCAHRIPFDCPKHTRLHGVSILGLRAQCNLVRKILFGKIYRLGCGRYYQCINALNQQRGVGCVW